MIKLKIKLLTFNGAPAFEKESAPERIEKLLPADSFEIVDSEDPDILFFLTGGSEKNGIESVKERKLYFLVGSEMGNAYASATEVKSYLDNYTIENRLLGEEDPLTPSALEKLYKVKCAAELLKGKRLGLIGNISEWLVNSDVSAESLRDLYGIELVKIDWADVEHFSKFDPSSEFIGMFSGRGADDLDNSARVHTMLTETISKHKLDAITVECFPMVQREGVTACLSLAKFNNDGLPAGCEGDLTAAFGMMVCRELTGVVPWIANVNRVQEGGSMFSHCTIAPGFLSDFSVTTHYETGKGNAIAGRFREDIVTIFRFDRELKRAFIAVAPVIGRPSKATACRTQIEVLLSSEDVNTLKESPLGNHHLIYPGDCSEMLNTFCRLKGVSIV